MARQYYPRVQVILHPIVSSGSTTDITDWFGDNCSITTSKGILEPSGSFAISFLDKRMGNDSVYARVHPMDGIEIRACHDGKKEPKVIMRGFVSRVSREEAFDEDGTPVRRVTINGEDVGKVWLIQYLYLLPTAEDQIKAMTGYGVLARYFGNSPKNVSGAQFVKAIGQVLADHVTVLTANTKMGLTLDFAPEGDGEIPSALLQSTTDISFYQLLASMLDAGAFYELWIDDPGEGPALLRWRLLWSGQAGEHVTQDDIASIQCWRDDSRVSNWYFAMPRGSMLVSQGDAYYQARRAGEICDGRKDQWSKEEHYGWRKLEVEMALQPESYPDNNDQPTIHQHQASIPAMDEWVNTKTTLLRNMNKDNSRLESCTIVLSGNEDMRPGTWVTVQKSEAAFKYYAVKVDHQIHLYNSFKTTLHGMRGERLSGDGSYREELDLKGVLK